MDASNRTSSIIQYYPFQILVWHANFWPVFIDATENQAHSYFGKVVFLRFFSSLGSCYFVSAFTIDPTGLAPFVYFLAPHIQISMLENLSTCFFECSPRLICDDSRCAWHCLREDPLESGGFNGRGQRDGSRREHLSIPSPTLRWNFRSSLHCFS